MNRYFALFIFGLFFSLSFCITAFEQDNNDHDNDQSTTIINGQVIVFLDDDSQDSSGLKTSKLKQIEFIPESLAYGKVLDVSPLLSIQNNYHAIEARQTEAKARYTIAKKNLSRLRNLHKNEAIPIQKVLQQQSQLQSLKAQIKAQGFQHQMIAQNSKLHWGNTLSQWLFDKNSTDFAHLITEKTKLLQITLPAGHSLQPSINSIFISAVGNRTSATPSSLISLLPKVDPLSQGLQYLFQTDNPSIKTGMNITAWIPQHKQQSSGVIIPASALVWHLGQAFVFIKIDDEHFMHKNIIHPIKLPTGYFISKQIEDGEEIVVTGAQMLLSHEFRSQIPDEDDDD